MLLGVGRFGRRPAIALGQRLSVATLRPLYSVPSVPLWFVLPGPRRPVYP